MEETELRGRERFDVSVTVEYRKRVAVLEHASAMIRKGGRCANVVFVSDSDDIRQKKRS